MTTDTPRGRERARLACPITAEELRHWYEQRQESMAQLARRLRVSEYHVEKWLRQHGVRIRGRGEANRISGKRRQDQGRDRDRDQGREPDH